MKYYKVAIVAEDYVWIRARDEDSALVQAESYGTHDMDHPTYSYEVVGDADGE